MIIGNSSLGIAFLYFENIYNLRHRSRALFDSSIHNKQPSEQLDTGSPSNKKPTTTSTTTSKSDDKRIQSDNRNNDNTSKCWDKEPFTVLESCHKCNSWLKSSLQACKPTGYREVLNCEKYGPVSRSCPMPVAIAIRHYWTFETVCLLLTLVFTSIAKRRKRWLDHLATERVRQQILSG